MGSVSENLTTMNWYYLQGEEQKGPFEQADFAKLVMEGVVGRDTLVWHEGMKDWQPYARAVEPQGGAVAVAEMPDAIPCGRCGQSFSREELVRIGGVPVCPGCKPLALQSLREGVALDGAAEEIRKAHISHEASVKSVGFLYLLGGAFILLASLGLMLAPNSARDAQTFGLAFGVILAVLAGLQIATGFALRKLRPWSRVAGGILSGIGLLGFPLGTLINGYILYLLLSKKGAMVFSEPYQRVIAATPHIKYRTSIIVWIVLGLLVLVLAIALAAAIFS